MTQTDEDLIEQSKAGNYVAFEQLIYRYDQNVLTIAARFTRSSEDAKDIYQETFIRVFKGLPKFQPILRPYVVKIVVPIPVQFIPLYE